MLYFNNNNSRSEECTFVTETAKNFNFNQPTTESTSYNNQHINLEYDYGLTCDKEDRSNYLLKKTSNPYNYNSTPIIDAIYPRRSKDNWYSTSASTENLKNQYSSQNSQLNPSDDEALENYLNDLAKNYDDIDRRIRDAERFVSQIEEAQTNKRYQTTNQCCSNNYSVKSVDELDNNNRVKYVTELRVNIADNASNDYNCFNKDTSTSNCQVYNDKCIIKPRSRVNNSLSPCGTRTSHISTTPTYKSNNYCYRVNHTTNHLYDNSSTKSDNTSDSNKDDDDDDVEEEEETEHENDAIPPPHCYLNRTIEEHYVNKEVQTSENYGNNYSSQYNVGTNTHVEERSVQTLSPLGCTIKATVDTGVGTEWNYYKKGQKSTSITKSISKPTLPDSYESDCTETEITCRTKSYLFNPAERRATISSDQLNFNDENNHLKKHKQKIITKPSLLGDNKSSEDNYYDDDNENENENDYDNLNTNEKNKKSTNKKFHFKDTIVKQKMLNKKKKKRIIKNNSKDDCIIKPQFNNILDNLPTDNFDSKDSATKNASFEIQKLLENLGNHLQATMSIKEPKLLSNDMIGGTFGGTYSNDSTASFWDNPLHKNDLNTVKKNFTTRSNTVREKNNGKINKNKFKKNKNNINSELQEICKTIEKDCAHEHDNDKLNRSDHDTEKSDHKLQINKTNQMLTGNTVTTGTTIPNTTTTTTTAAATATSNPPINPSNNNLTKSSSMAIIGNGDNFSTQQYSNLKITKTFELSPYDDLIKSHLSPFDRRVKAVAAKNGCHITIDGPINAYDPTSCQAFRNKITYRCTVAGQSKENLDKCMNYLKETFPNTFLRINQRSG